MNRQKPVAVTQDAATMDNCIHLLAQGKKEAMERLYNASASAIFAYALSMLKNKSDAEDVLHDCFIKVFHASTSYRTRGKPMAWIITIARNLCIERLRERQRNVAEEDWQNYLDSTDASSLDKLTVEKCLTTLGDDERQIVVLYTTAGMKHREIAKLLGLTLSTVLSKYSRALKKLRAQLTDGE